MGTLGQLLGEKQFKGKMKYMQVRGRRRPLASLVLFVSFVPWVSRVLFVHQRVYQPYAFKTDFQPLFFGARMMGVQNHKRTSFAW